jgi:tetratricopeptide (TPR) repeat protein
MMFETETIVRDPDPLSAGMSRCAVLRLVDASSLAALGVSADTLAALVAQEVLHVGDPPGRYRLSAATRRAVLTHLRQTNPRAEIDLHACAFRHFTGRLATSWATPTEQAMEAECLYHLGALHDLFIEYMEWDAIIPYTSALKVVSRSGHVRDWVAFYRAYTAIRTGALDHGNVQLLHLLSRDELEPALRLRVLHARHIALVYQSRYDRALQLLHAARPIARKLGDLTRYSYLLLSIGQIYNDLYNHRRALTLSRRSRRFAVAAGATYRELHALYEIGNNAMQLGLWEEATAALSQVEADYRRLGMPARLPMVLWARGMLALIHADWSTCRQLVTEGLAISHQEQHGDPLATMDLLLQLGLVDRITGDAVAARTAFTRALDHAQSADLRHWQPIIQARLAEMLARQGNAAEALALWRAAADAAETVRSHIDNDDICVSFFGTTQYIYESLVLFLLARGDVAGAFTYVERARSRAFLDQLARQDRLEQSGAPWPQAHLQAQLGSGSAVTLAELQQCLAPGEVVLEYFATGVRPRGDHWQNRIPAHNQTLRTAVLAPPSTILFIITHDAVQAVQIRNSDHATADDPHGHAAPHLDTNKLQPSAYSDDPVLDMLRVERVMDWLARRLLAPAEPWLAGCHQIYLIPHGPLHYVPFTALRRRDGRYLLDAGGPAVSFAPSASVLNYALRRQPAHPGAGSLVIGYNGPPERRLEHAEYEAAHIAGLIGGDLWAGPAAKRAQLMGEPRRLRWLHIASHTIYDSRRTHTAGLHLGAEDLLNAKQILSMNTWACRADMVTLSSCMSGFSSIVAGDELFGLQRACLYAIAPTVVCTMARVRDRVALLVMEQLYTRLRDDAALRPAAALRDALVTVRQMRRTEVNSALERHGFAPLPEGGHPDDQPFNRPEYWALFILIGRP